MKIVSPETVGLDAARLARIGAITRRYVDQGKLAALSPWSHATGRWRISRPQA